MKITPIKSGFSFLWEKIGSKLGAKEKNLFLVDGKTGGQKAV
jgi:hypothetical protein